MKRFIALSLCLVFILCSVAGCESPDNTPDSTSENTTSSEEKTFDLTELADAETALDNPDKGWYIHYYDNELTKYGNGLMPEDIEGQIKSLDHVYLRLAWSYLEPKEGKFDWDVIDKVIDPWTAAGYKVSFRISCREFYDPKNPNMKQYYATPKWVKDAGAKGSDIENGWVPDYSDPIFLEKLYNFHKAFAERYDSNPMVIYTDVGSLGIWGEGHTFYGDGQEWTLETVKKHCDIYFKNYKNTQVVVSDDLINALTSADDRLELVRYLAENGGTVRDDSIGVTWQVNNFKNSVQSPEYFDAMYKNHPTILENEHYSINVENGVWDNGKVLEAAIVTCHATYAGFHGDTLQWLSENRENAGRISNKMGYWYFIDSLSEKSDGDNLTVGLTLRNNGACHAYNRYHTAIILTDKNGTSTEFEMSSLDNTTVMADKSETFTETFDISKLSSGKYTLSVRMYNDSGRTIELALKNKNDDGSYTLCEITL